MDYQQSKPFQLSLFNLFENEKEFSHTIELYDFMPKFVRGKVERVAGVFLHSIEREFECRGKKYLLTVIPASIKDANGKEPNHPQQCVAAGFHPQAISGSRSGFAAQSKCQPG